MAKKIIGISATAAAAAIVAMLSGKLRVESAGRGHKANDPARNRTPIAKASVIINAITFL